MSKTVKTANIAEEAVASFTKAFDAAKNYELPTAAREFVKRTNASAQERVESAHAGASNAATRVENFATAFVGGYADFTRGLIEASLSNAQHAFSTVEKLAGAQSMSEAVQIQADYVRESARVNFDRAKTTAESARASIADGVKQVQSELSALYPKKAA
ncbi:MAG: phasin family protein [Mesorhizobium sp.]